MQGVEFSYVLYMCTVVASFQQSQNVSVLQAMHHIGKLKNREWDIEEDEELGIGVVVRG